MGPLTMLSWNKVTTLSILLAIPIADAFGTVNAPLQRNSHVLLASTTTTPTSDDNIVVTPSGEGNKEVDVSNTRPVVIVGGGPAGLLTAIMCAKTLGTERPIKVYDRLSPPLNPRDDAVWSDVTKFYLIGLNGRGQKALQKYGVWDAVESVCTVSFLIFVSIFKDDSRTNFTKTYLVGSGWAQGLGTECWSG